VRVLKRDDRNLFSVVWSVDLDPDSTDVVRAAPPAPAPIPIRHNGPSPQKVDLRDVQPYRALLRGLSGCDRGDHRPLLTAGGLART
jgi:hypothetical protein